MVGIRLSTDLGGRDHLISINIVVVNFDYSAMLKTHKFLPDKTNACNFRHGRLPRVSSCVTVDDDHCRRLDVGSRCRPPTISASNASMALLRRCCVTHAAASDGGQFRAVLDCDKNAKAVLGQYPLRQSDLARAP